MLKNSSREQQIPSGFNLNLAKLHAQGSDYSNPQFIKQPPSDSSKRDEKIDDDHINSILGHMGIQEASPDTRKKLGSLTQSNQELTPISQGGQGGSQ